MKRDLKDAFRHISVAISDQWLLGFYCDGCYWIERYLPFGLRLTINHSKDIMGTTADFLGIEFDSILMQARLPSDKLARARTIAKTLLNSATVSHKELESAVGFLTFTAKIVIPGRAFLRRLFDALRRPISIHRIIPNIKANL